MAIDDKGLVLRGFFVLALVGVLVTVVTSILFLRPQQALPTLPPGDALASAPGWEIRYNAAAALARRGSAKVPWPLMREMLDEDQQMRNARVRLPDGQDIVDESSARSMVIGALKALAAWHEKQKAEGKREMPAELADIYAEVDKLAGSAVPELKTQAEKARATFWPANP
jgi:hypothetical protein